MALYSPIINKYVSGSQATRGRARSASSSKANPHVAADMVNIAGHDTLQVPSHRPRAKTSSGNEMLPKFRAMKGLVPAITISEEADVTQPTRKRSMSHGGVATARERHERYWASVGYAYGPLRDEATAAAEARLQKELEFLLANSGLQTRRTSELQQQPAADLRRALAHKRLIECNMELVEQRFSSSSAVGLVEPLKKRSASGGDLPDVERLLNEDGKNKKNKPAGRFHKLRRRLLKLAGRRCRNRNASSSSSTASTNSEL